MSVLIGGTNDRSHRSPAGRYHNRKLIDNVHPGDWTNRSPPALQSRGDRGGHGRSGGRGGRGRARGQGGTGRAAPDGRRLPQLRMCSVEGIIRSGRAAAAVRDAGASAWKSPKDRRSISGPRWSGCVSFEPASVTPIRPPGSVTCSDSEELVSNSGPNPRNR